MSVASGGRPAAVPGLGSVRTPDVIAWLVVGVAFVGAFWLVISKQVELSLRYPEDWGHAFIMPLVAGYAVWLQRKTLASLRPRVFVPGLLALLFGVFAYFYSAVVIRNHMATGFSTVIALYGVVLFLLGARYAQVLFLPIAILALCVTISNMVMDAVVFPLQLLASDGAFRVLGVLGKLFGFAVAIDGNVLSVDGNQLNVAEACSGLRMLVAFYALSAAIALLGCRRWWHRIAVLMLAGPVALLVNISRVAVLGLATLVNPDLASGSAHSWIGTALLFPAMLLFMGMIWLMKKATPDEPRTAAPAPLRQRPFWLKDAWPAGLLTLCVLGAMAWGFERLQSGYGAFFDKQAVYAEGNRQLSAISPELPGWSRVGADRLESAEIIEELGTQNYLTRSYTKRSDPSVRLEFHGAYYTDMIDTVPHVPERCFVGGGLKPASRATVVPLEVATSSWRADPTVPEALRGESGTLYRVRVPNGVGPNGERFSDAAPGALFRLPRDITPERPFQLRVSEFTTDSGGPRIFAGYFFIANGAAYASAEAVRQQGFNLTDRYAYYCKVQFTGVGYESVEAFADEAASLLGDLLPELMRCVPDWVELKAGELSPTPRE